MHLISKFLLFNRSNKEIECYLAFKYEFYSIDKNIKVRLIMILKLIYIIRFTFTLIQQKIELNIIK